MNIKKLASMIVTASLLSWAGPALAGHNGAVVESTTVECGETTFAATIADPAGTHKVGNMYMIVSVDGDTQFVKIPTDGTDATISVGPFYGATAETKTISWNVFGGAERSYDQPLWNGYGDPGFGAAIVAYAASVGGYGWVLEGPDDPNPFVNWNEVEVESCAIEKNMCKDGGWETFNNPEFKNQGQCVSYVQSNDNAGKRN